MSTPFFWYDRNSPAKACFMEKAKLYVVLSPVLGLGLILFGVQKFGGPNPIFEIIADRSGIELFEPVIRRVVGVAEILAGGFLLFKPTRMTGALLGLFVLIGAIGFHLSPWLGISVPGGGHGLFITAIIMLAIALINVILLKKAGETPLFFK